MVDECEGWTLCQRALKIPAQLASRLELDSSSESHRPPPFAPVVPASRQLESIPLSHSSVHPSSASAFGTEDALDLSAAVCAGRHTFAPGPSPSRVAIGFDHTRWLSTNRISCRVHDERRRQRRNAQRRCEIRLVRASQNKPEHRPTQEDRQTTTRHSEKQHDCVADSLRYHILGFEVSPCCIADARALQSKNTVLTCTCIDVTHMQLEQSTITIQ
jgi:hypothetical protein